MSGNTERARQVIVLAQEEARSAALRHNYIGTEHLLLGVLREQHGLGAQVLESLGMSVERTRVQVVQIIGTGSGVSSGQIPFTPRAKTVLELALREMLSAGDPDIDTEHILLALTSVPEGVAMRILADFDATPTKIRNAVAGRRPRRPTKVGDRETESPIDTEWLAGLSTLQGPLGVEIRAQLGREPDVGDLLLCLTCMPDSPAGRALRQLNIDVDQLKELIDQARAEARGMDAVAEELREATQAKERAVEEQRFEDATRLQNHQRELRRQTPARPRPPSLDELRRRLGLLDPGNS